VPVQVSYDLGMVIDLPDMRIGVPVGMAEALLNNGFLLRNGVKIRLFQS
jgi:hypothetical protein